MEDLAKLCDSKSIKECVDRKHCLLPYTDRSCPRYKKLFNRVKQQLLHQYIDPLP